MAYGIVLFARLVPAAGPRRRLPRSLRRAPDEVNFLGGFLLGGGKEQIYIYIYIYRERDVVL